MHKSRTGRILVRSLVGLVGASALILGPGAPAANASTTCSLPVGEGAVTPSGGNSVALGTTSAAVANVTCASLDFDSYTVEVHAGIFYADGSVCGWGGTTGASIAGAGTISTHVLCSTSGSDPRVNELQTLVVWGTTSNGVTTQQLSFPMA